MHGDSLPMEYAKSEESALLKGDFFRLMAFCFFLLPLCLLLWGGVYGCLAMPCLPALECSLCSG